MSCSVASLEKEMKFNSIALKPIGEIYEKKTIFMEVSDKQGFTPQRAFHFVVSYGLQHSPKSIKTVVLIDSAQPFCVGDTPLTPVKATDDEWMTKWRSNPQFQEYPLSNKSNIKYDIGCTGFAIFDTVALSNEYQIDIFETDPARTAILLNHFEQKSTSNSHIVILRTNEKDQSVPLLIHDRSGWTHSVSSDELMNPIEKSLVFVNSFSVFSIIIIL